MTPDRSAGEPTRVAAAVPPVAADRTAADATVPAGAAAEAPGAIDPAPPSGPGAARAPERTGRAAAAVAVGILASRVLGFVRQGVFSRYFGTGDAADAYNAAMRIPNVLQNLFGEGVLSASFIPVYAALLGRGEREAADRVARAVGALLALVTAALVAVGMAATPWLVATVAAGFTGQKRELTTALVRITFPGIGLLVMSAWCLGVLNSHRRFLLSYLAPVASNVVVIGTLLWFGGEATGGRLATIVAWGAVLGAAAQLLVQLPTVARVAPGLWRRAGRGAGDAAVRAEVRLVVRNFLPTLLGRGVVQISGYIDNALASLVAPGAVTVFTNAQTLYILPGSLFGMSVAAAELPAMARLQGGNDEVAAHLRARLSAGLRRIAFFVVPSAAAFLALGDVLAAAVFQYGRFTADDVRWVWGTLAGSSIGLLASTMGRLYASTFYALKDTRTPLRFALLRVTLTLGLGYVGARHAPGWLGVSPRWGTVGLTATSGAAGWVEYALLRRALHRRLGGFGVPGAALGKLWGAAGLAATAGWGVKLAVDDALPPLARAGLVVAAFGAFYLALTAVLREGESAALVGRVRRRLGR